MPLYKYTKQDVEDLAIAARHAYNGDEIGLKGRRLVLCRLISYLPHPDKCVVRDYFSASMSMEEIAEFEHMDVSNVSRTIGRAISKINAQLGCINVAMDENSMFALIKKKEVKDNGTESNGQDSS